MKECVGSQGKHESQTCQLKIQSDSVRNLLLTQKKAVKAKLKKDGIVIFSGVIRPALSVSSRAKIVDALSVQIIDDTETLHQYVYDRATDDAVSANLLTEKTYYNYYVCNPNSVQNSLVHVLFGLGGVTIKSCPTITEQVSRFDLQAGDYLDDAIGTLLYEFCATYRMTPGGVEIAKVFQDATGTVANIKNTLSVKKADSVANGTTVEFSKYLTQENFKCYSESISELPGLANLGGYEFTHNYWPKDIKAQTRACWWDFSNFNAGQKVTAKNFKVLAYNEGRSAFYKIPHMDTYDQEKGYPYVEYYGLYRSGVFARRGMSLEVYCDIDYTAQDTAKAGVVGVSPAKYQAKYIHNLTDAQNLANFQQKVQNGANYTYSFQSTDNYTPGATLTLNENSNLNLNSKIRILSKTSTEQEGLFSYTAEGADDVTITEPDYEHEKNVLPPVTDVEFLSLSIDNTIYSQDTEETIVLLAAGSAFDWYNRTPSWTLNGSAIDNATTTLSLSSSALSVGQNVIAVSVTLDGQITSKAVTLQYIATSSQGEPGAPAKVFSLSASSYSYVISKRQTTDQTIQITLDVQNIEGDVAWSSLQGATFNTETKVLTIPARNTIDSFTLTATLGDESRSVTLTGVVQEDVPLYFGALSAAPSGSFIAGDHYLNTTDYIPYVYSETANSGAGGWIALTTSSPYYYTVINDTVADFGKLGVQAPEGSVFANYYESFVAQKAFINKLGATDITLLTGGAIHSDGHTWPSDFPNNPEQAKGFSANADGKIRAEGMETVNMKAVDAEIAGSFKAQSMETVDEVPAISNLQNFSTAKSNALLYAIPLERFQAIKTISSSAYKLLSIDAYGRIIGSVDGQTFVDFGIVGDGEYSPTNDLIWDSTNNLYYAIAHNTIDSQYANYVWEKGKGVFKATSPTEWTFCRHASKSMMYVFVTDSNKGSSDTADTLVLFDANYLDNSIMEADAFRNGDQVYSTLITRNIVDAYKIAYNNGHLVILKNQSVLCHSGSITDSASLSSGWNEISLGYDYLYTDIAYGNGYFVIVGSNSEDLTAKFSYSSDNGASWQSVTESGIYSDSGLRVWFVNNQFVASDQMGGIYIANSSSLTSWTQYSAPSNINDITWDGTLYIVVTNDGWYVSADLSTWKKTTAPITINSVALTPSNEAVAICYTSSESYALQAGSDVAPIVDYYSNLKGNGVKDDNGEDLTDEPLKFTHAVTGTLNGKSLAFMRATPLEVTCTFTDNTTKTLTWGVAEPTAITLNNVKIAKTDASVKLLNPKVSGRGSVPIGFIYTQYPNQQSPELIFDGEWEDISADYAGAFFRAEGGDSLAFGTKQSEGLPNIKGNVNVATWGRQCGGAFLDGGAESDNAARSGSGSGLGGYRRNFDASAGEATTDGTIRTTPLVYGKSDHVTPLNYAVRIWKRTN
jgi:hypothetical protein